MLKKRGVGGIHIQYFLPPSLGPDRLLKPCSSLHPPTPYHLPTPTLCYPPRHPTTLPSCPAASSSILIFCTQVVSQRFPQNSIGAVGSAMFLRFVNPAIVSPYEAGILDKKPLPRIERGLKLMSKVKGWMNVWKVSISNYFFFFFNNNLTGRCTGTNTFFRLGLPSSVCIMIQEMTSLYSLNTRDTKSLECFA